MALQLLKSGIAVTLPLHVDEAFYCWEGQYLAWAYSDVPGMTAWLARVGTEIGGYHAVALRSTFLLFGAAVPWLVIRISRRWYGSAAGWLAGILALLMPLSGLLGVLATPDVVIVFASLLCIDAVAQLRERISWTALASLAVGLVLGALSHYRFALVILAGAIGVLSDSPTRKLLVDWRVWLAAGLGLLAWLPLLLWNLSHDEAGVRFQFIDRHPWHFDAGALVWLPIQALLVSPVLFVLLLATLLHAWRQRNVGVDQPWRLLGAVGATATLCFFLLGFFVDRQRVSFHWPLAGWLLLITGAPLVLMTWSRAARAALWFTATLALAGALAFLLAASAPAARNELALTRFYPGDFAGWSELMRESKELRGPIIASDFATAAHLAFSLGRRDIRVLDSPLNHKHGRAVQLENWKLLYIPGRVPAATLVWNDTAISLKDRLAAYRHLCRELGSLPEPRILQFDRGRRRYLVYSLQAGPVSTTQCVLPAIAAVDSPATGSVVGRTFDVIGWAFKDDVGIARVDVLIDDRVVAIARYGIPAPHVAGYWKISGDPTHPNVGFVARIDASELAPGPHELAVRLHGLDGSSEAWPPQRVIIDPSRQ